MSSNAISLNQRYCTARR